MVSALLGKKVGMSQIYTEAGKLVPVTVVAAGPCTIMQIKTKETDEAMSLQLGFEDKRRHRATKPEQGHAKKAKCEPKKFVREVPLDNPAEYQLGQALTVGVFEGVKKVDVIGTTKGKGFQGGMKRYGFHGQGASHGVSMRHRAPGSSGSNTDPARTWPGTRRPGHMGARRRTTRNLELVKIDKDRNLLLIKGAVPGPNGGYLVIRKAKAWKDKSK
ncbi:MAG: 50S ribosomal protein L3 [Planctomycetes bacterium]|nr:50S ribosomal protein L3 [Planctomycetota bacterium]MBM4080253.1 50S ribosomal protein L3 [Planctomycetota bacterium]MBM4084655.1 50S ribosomal protein L3 [Planctomycetota bacterium]